MSGDVRRSAAILSVVPMLVTLALAGGAAAQSPVASSDPVERRCPGTDAGGAHRRDVAALTGPVAMVEALQVTPECIFPIEPADELEPAALVRLMDRVGIDQLHVVADGGDDLLTLDGGAIQGEPDPALRIEELRFGSGAIARDDVSDVVRFIERGRIDELNPVLGQAAADLIERGRWQLVLLDTASDPTVPSDAVRTWELGLAARIRGATCALVGGMGNPYSGVRQLLTYAQVPVEGGRFEGRVGRTDFGAERLGPDGQTQFFNARPTFAAFAYEGGVGFLFPAELDPVGFRAWSRAGGSNAWDIVQGPGGPQALIPPDGSWAGMHDLFLPSVVHEPVTMPAIIDGAAAPAHEFPSQVQVLFGAPLVDPGQPLTVDLGYRVEDTSVRFEDLEAAPLGDGLYGVRFGIPRYGLYALEEWVVEEFGELPEGWDELSEAARGFGWALFLVGEEEGPIHGSLVRPWLTGEGPTLHHPYDPALLRWLVPPGPKPGIVGSPQAIGDVSEQTVDIAEVAIGRGRMVNGMPGPLGFAIRTAAGPAPDEVWSSMVGVRCGEGPGVADGSTPGFSVTRERHDGVERTVTEGIAESSVRYREMSWGHLIEVSPGVADLVRFCEAFTGFMDAPDGAFVEDTSGPIEVGRTMPMDDLVATLERQVGGSVSEPTERVVVIGDPASDVTQPTVDITDIAVARTEEATGGTRIALGIRTAGGPAPATRNGSSVYVHCRVASSAPGGRRDFTIFHYDFEGREETFVDSYDHDLEARGVTYERTTWGHLVTFTVEGGDAEDVLVRCQVMAGTQDAGGGSVTDRTGEFLVEVTQPVEDILEEIETRPRARLTGGPRVDRGGTPPLLASVGARPDPGWLRLAGAAATP